MSPEDPEERAFFVPRITTDMPRAARRGETAERRFPKEEGGDIGLFNPHTGNGLTPLFSPCADTAPVTTLAWSPADRMLICGCQNGWLRRYDFNTGPFDPNENPPSISSWIGHFGGAAVRDDRTK